MVQTIALIALILLPLAFSYSKVDQFGDGLIQEIFNRYDNNRNQDSADMDNEGLANIDIGHPTSYKNQRSDFQTRMDEILLGREPSLRDREYLEHSPSQFGPKYIAGGAGEGWQLLKPDGSVPNYAVVKSDTILPTYCDPPNPCPLGYSAEDGCLEEFENTAAFSRDYQSSQKCMCDREHMYDCPGESQDNRLDSIARSIQNNVPLTDQDISRFVENIQQDHKVVAKKFHESKKRVPEYLNDEKLPVVAKKSPIFSQG